MIRLRYKLLISLFRVFDQGLVFFALAVSLHIVGRALGKGGIDQFLHRVYSSTESLGIAVLALGWLAIFSVCVRYDANRFTSFSGHIADFLKASTLSAFFLVVLTALFGFERVTNLTILVFWLVTSALGVLSRLALRGMLMAARRSGYNHRHLLIVGFNDEALRMAERIDASPELGYKIVGFISDSPKADAATDSRVVGHLPDLKGILERGTVDEIIVCLPVMERFPAICEIVRFAQELGVVARLFPEAGSAKFLTQINIERFEGDFIVTFFRERMVLQLFAKRLMDLAVSTIMLVVLSPLLLVVAALIKLTSPGPVLFVQERVGMNRRKFKLYKFRSMVVDAEARKKDLAAQNEMDGPVFKIKNDPRITGIGRFIRKTSIDELPQLFNVFMGHMSLVGPRPPLLTEVDQYEWLYRKRLSIKPGLTCLWQISGRNNISFKQWMQMDREYIENWSIWLDLEILLKTIPVVLLGRGAS